MSRALAEFCGMPEEELVEVPVDDPVELFVPLDDGAADEPEELELLAVLEALAALGEIEEWVIGWKVLFLGPKPTADG